MRGVENRLTTSGTACRTREDRPHPAGGDGAEVELYLALRLDVIFTAAGFCAIWAWLSGTSTAKG
jgi:hypothetical protein